MAPVALLRHIADTAPDADLLRRFVAGREPDAFAELVRRHGPVVYRVCRRLLGASSADDAFQATFLILATRPESVRKAGSVGSWLVGVSGRVARQMRKRERRFLASGGRQPPVGASQQGADAPRSPELVEQFRILDEELTRLPDRLRAPVVLCLLQGRTQEQAVAELGGSVRTIRRRLEEAKQLLRLRLERRGVVPAVAAGLAAGVGEATATVPAELPGRTVATVFDFLAGGSAVTAPAAVIARGVAMGTLAYKVKVLMVTAAVGLTALGVGVAGADGPKPAAPPSPGIDILAPVPVGPGPRPAAPLPAPVVVDGPIVRAVAMEFMHQRDQIHAKWVGAPPREVPRRDVPPPLPSLWGGVFKNMCIRVIKKGEPIMPPPAESTTLVYTRDGDPSDAVTEITYKEGRAIQAWVYVAGPLEDVLENQLPREVTHVVLANHAGKPLPRWVADGAARIAESPTWQAEYDRVCREMLVQGKAIHLSALFKMTDAPKGQAHAVAQGHSVTRYLLTRKAVFTAPVLRDVPHLGELFRKPPEAAFLAFAQLGADEGWDKAAKAVYGFDDVAALEKAWIGWLSTPESRLAKKYQPRPKVVPVKGLESPHIPPVTLSGGQPVRVGTIVIEGNATVTQKVILDQLGLFPGKVLDYQQLKKGRDNLIRLGVFDPADPPAIDQIPRHDGSGLIDFRVRVKELRKDK